MEDAFQDLFGSSDEDADIEESGSSGEDEDVTPPAEIKGGVERNQRLGSIFLASVTFATTNAMEGSWQRAAKMDTTDVECPLTV